jgi:hypothetical protein
MMKFLLASLLALLLVACEKNDNEQPLSSSNDIILSQLLYSTAPADPFFIDTVQISNDSIIISISYGGGCGTVVANLYDAEAIAESNPVQRSIRLSFKDNDNCEALVKRDYAFNLKPVQLQEYDKMFLNLTAWDEPLLYQY